jgi:Tfp pilus assembly protein PilX
MQINKKQNTKSKSGFALLFSILLASFLITLGISIFSISLKEIQITTSLRDSQSAYYAADSALECALYWGTSATNYFPPCTQLTSQILCTGQSSLTGPATVPVDLTCNGKKMTLDFVTEDGKNFDTGKIINFFEASSTASSTPVADIEITKSFLSAGYVQTTVTAWGHNTSILGRRVERALSKVY